MMTKNNKINYDDPKVKLYICYHNQLTLLEELQENIQENKKRLLYEIGVLEGIAKALTINNMNILTTKYYGFLELKNNILKEL